MHVTCANAYEGVNANANAYELEHTNGQTNRKENMTWKGAFVGQYSGWWCSRV